MEQLFGRLGFTPAEAKVYLSLAELGKGAASAIAKRAALPRSTVYSALDALITRGMVSIEQDQEVALYVANPPNSLQIMLESQKEDFLREQHAREQAANELSELVSPFFKSEHYSVPRIQFFEGKKNVETLLYQQEKEWQRSISQYDFTWWGYQDTQFVEDYQKWLQHYWTGMFPDERICLISNIAEIEETLRGKVQRRTIKQLPPGAEFSSTIWILGEYVVLIMTRQRPHYAFQIKDAVLAANQRTTFQMLWNLMK